MKPHATATIDIAGGIGGVINGPTLVQVGKDGNIEIAVGWIDTVTMRLTPTHAAALTADIANALHLLVADKAGVA